MATITYAGGITTLSLTTDEQYVLDALREAGDTAFEGYVTLWLEHRFQSLATQRLSQLSPQEKTTMLATMKSTALAEDTPQQL